MVPFVIRDPLACNFTMAGNAVSMTDQNLYTWSQWQDSTSTTITNPNYSYRAWDSWINAGTLVTSFVPSVQVWKSWETAHHTYQPPPPPTPEEVQAMMRRAMRGDMVRRNRERTSGLRAKRLLVSHLDHAQRASFREKGGFEVTAQSGKRYLIEYGQAGNVYELDAQGRKVCGFCIHPRDVPNEDAMLAQKFMLETDEEAFLRTANRHPLLIGR